MASIVSVEQIKGLASGSTPNTISIPSGQKLHAPGHIIQIQSTPLLGQVSFSTVSTWNQTNHSCSITPQFSTSKIFVMLTTSIVHSNSAGDNLVQIKRGSTVVTGDNIYSSNSNWKGYNVTLMKLDSPATTSAITYTVQCWHNGGGQMLYNYTNYGFTESVLTAMEIPQ
jgi:hypothetical protein